MLLPNLLNVIVEFLLCHLQWLAQVLKQFMVIVLLRPVSRIKTVVVSDSRFQTCLDQKLTDLGTTIPRCQMQASETRLVLDRGIATILYKELASFVKILFNSFMEGCILAYFMIFLEVRIRTVL